MFCVPLSAAELEVLRVNELNWQLSAENVLSRSSCSDIDEINRNGLNLLLGNDRLLKFSKFHRYTNQCNLGFATI